MEHSTSDKEVTLNIVVLKSYQMYYVLVYLQESRRGI